MGATHIVDANVEDMQLIQHVVDICGGLVDMAIDMVGHQGRTFDMCCQMVTQAGTVLLFGLPPAANCRPEEAMTISLQHVVRNVNVICSHSPGVDMFRFAMEMLQNGRIDLRPIFTHTFEFANFAEAYAAQANYEKGVVKSIIDFRFTCNVE